MNFSTLSTRLNFLINKKLNLNIDFFNIYKKVDFGEEYGGI